MTALQIFLAVLTEPQVDRVIDLCFKIVQGIGYATSILLPALLLYFQRKNKDAITAKVDQVTTKVDQVTTKVDESTAASNTALTVANGHNEKIAKLTEIVAESTGKAP